MHYSVYTRNAKKKKTELQPILIRKTRHRDDVIISVNNVTDTHLKHQ